MSTSFGRALLCSLVLLSLGCCLLLGVCASPARAQPLTPHIILLNCPDDDSMARVADDVERLGGLVRHLFPPHVLIAELSPDTAQALFQYPEVDFVSDGFIDPDVVPVEYGRAARDAVVAWNNVFVATPAPLQADPNAPPGLPLINDALMPPDQPPADAFGEAIAPAPPGAASWQTSEYMMGSITVALILPESDNSVDTSTEDWTTTEQQNVQSETLAALNWWISQYPYPVHKLSVTWVRHYSVATGYEPISRPQSDEGRWISDALTALGYPCTHTWPSYFNAARSYADNLRNAHNTDWAYLIFVVDSSNDADGKFSDNTYFGYAYVGGPFTVMTYDNDGWGIASMDKVCAHETGHIFRAGDEYLPACTTTSFYGYLNIQNTNCGTNPTCIMYNNSWAVCSVTQQQIGWRDTDSDTVPDILDVAPAASLNTYLPDPVNDATPTYTGSASVAFYPNQLNPPWDCTVNRIANVQYRVDGGSWQSCTAADGAFDGGTESYSFTTSSLSYGPHTFEVRAVDDSGNTTGTPYPSDTLSVCAHSLTVTAVPNVMTLRSQGTANLTGSAVDGAGHPIASWTWDDAGAGGAFSPGASSQNPSYTAPVNATGSNQQITITLTATCSGTCPQTDSDSFALTLTYDYDGDGMPDYWEQAHGLNDTSSADAAVDPDGDGLSNYQEYVENTDPGDADSDDDEIPDGWEAANNLDPNGGGDAASDDDNDGLTNLQEYQNGGDPADRDTDGDGFGDGEEVSLGSDPDSSGDTPAQGHFSDVSPTGYGEQGADPHWAFHEIEACYRAGIVAGYTEGTYGCAQSVDRAQMAVYVSRALAGGDENVPAGPAQATFDDVPAASWAYDHIEYAVWANVVQGYDEFHYLPDQNLDRSQMAVFIARSIADPTGEEGLDGFQDPAVPTFDDVPTECWGYTHIEYCVENDVVHGYEDGLYHPEIIVTRDQMAVYICRAFELPL